jgi:SIR2-like protein
MKNQVDIQENIFNIVQTFLKNPPLIVWGSGATIPFGLPSMRDLNEVLKKKIDGFNTSNDNLEIELGKDKYQDKMPQIKKIIWEKVNQADISVLERIISNNTIEFNGIKLLIEKFIEAHPKVVNIVTTNYDRVLEHIMSYHNFPYTDGFNGKILSIFDESEFKNKEIINLIKVHGSLSWFDVNGEIRFLSSISKDEAPKIIAPGKNKYKEAYSSPYRELIQKADGIIKTASSFLVIGFGFNDEHLTPKIKAKVKKGTPVVLITKKVSGSSYEELKDAEKYILFEESESRKTKVIYKENRTTDKIEIELEGDLWQLNNFMEIL